MAKQLKVFNPFYVLLMIVGVVFAFTALGYVVMSVKMLEPASVTDRDAGFVRFFDQHGVTLFLVEIGVLAVLTVLAIATDGYWTRRAERRQQSGESASDE